MEEKPLKAYDVYELSSPSPSMGYNDEKMSFLNCAKFERD